jgi:hypothetical protein
MIYHHSRTAGWYPSAFAHGQHVDAGRTVKGAPYFFEDDSERELHEGAFLPYLRVRGRTHLPGYQPPITMLLPACDELVTIRWAQGTRRAATSEAHAPAVIGLHAQRHKKSRRTCCARLLTLSLCHLEVRRRGCESFVPMWSGTERPTGMNVRMGQDSAALPTRQDGRVKRP